MASKLQRLSRLFVSTGQASGVVSPFLHHLEDRIDSPLGRATIPRTDPLAALLAAAAAGGPLEGSLLAGEADRLEAGRFLVPSVAQASLAFRLRYANIETCSVCNHRCAFCPVSLAPRPAETMPQELFERILDQVRAAGDPDVGVFLNNYNEPTVDPLFLERLRALFRRGLPVGLLTNAARLTPELADTVRAEGQVTYLGVNLPTLDDARYREMHGTKDLPRVLANLAYLFEHPIAAENAFVVLGYGDARHDADVAAIAARFGATGWAVRRFVVQSRSGIIDTAHAPLAHARLAGCDQMGSRPFEHLHVVASGRAIFCCQDYHEAHVVGDLATGTVAEVLASPELARLRRWTYGVEEAPEDFMCRRCEFALSR